MKIDVFISLAHLIIKLVIDEVVIDGEKLKISATIPLPDKIRKQEIKWI